MRRSVILILFLAACSGVGADTTTTTGDGSDVPATTSPQGDETTSTTDGVTESTAGEEATTTTDSGREVAPDFTLELGDGGSYTLAEGEKPVYLVFWAEW